MADKTGRTAVIIIAVIVATLVVTVIMLRQRTGPLGESDSTEAASRPASLETAASTRMNVIATPVTGVERRKPADTTTSSASDIPVPTSPDEPVQNAVSAYHVDDFRSTAKAFEGYKLAGLKLTADGIALADREPGTSGTRTGTLESPSLKLEFPANLVGPIWRTKMPEGTEFKVELAVSADGKDWSPWFPCEADDEADPLPNYPDGRPNPNYGATIGSHVGTGLKLYPYVRYRLTMNSGGDQSPLLQEMRLYHVDATAGQGFVAGTQPPPGYVVEPEPVLATTPIPGHTNPTPGPSPTPPHP